MNIITKINNLKQQKIKSILHKKEINSKKEQLENGKKQYENGISTLS